VYWNSNTYELESRVYEAEGIKYVGVGNAGILGFESENQDLNFFAYLKTLDNGEQIGEIVTTLTYAYNYFGIVYAPTVIHNIGLEFTYVENI